MINVRRAVRDDEDELLPLAPNADPFGEAGMAIWREKLFSWMLRNAASAMEFFRLPTNRVVELGSQLEISPSDLPVVPGLSAKLR